MPFATFLAKAQEMFNLFEQVGEPYGEQAKLRFLLEKVQNAELKTTVAAVSAAVGLDPDSYTFTSAANHLSAQVKPRSQGRSLSAVTSDDNTAIMKNGKIITGYIPNWRSLTPAQRDLVMAERERQGVKPRKSGGDKSSRNQSSRNLKKQIKALAKTVERQGTKISALKRGSADDDSTAESTTSADSTPGNNAGSSFGGRAEKEKSKKKKKRKD
jgi:hypothetical protein